MGGSEPRDGGRNHIFRSLKAAGLSISVKGLPKLSSLKQRLYFVHNLEIRNMDTSSRQFSLIPVTSPGAAKAEAPTSQGISSSSLVPQYSWPVSFSACQLTGPAVLTRWPHGCLIVLRFLQEDQLPQDQSLTQALSLLKASLASLRTLCLQSLLIPQGTKVSPGSQGGNQTPPL